MGATAVPLASPPMSRPVADRALGVMTWGLAFHMAAIAVLNGPLQLPVGLVRLLAAWKEAAIALLVVAMAARLLRQRERFAPAICDVAAVSLVLVVMMRSGLDWLLFGIPPVSPMAAYGARDLLVPFVVYGIGRLTPEVLDHPALMRRMAAVALVTAALGFVERLLPIEALVVAGVPAYYRDFLNVEGMTNPAFYGLPHSYFTDLGNEAFRRAGSVFLSGQSFAIALMLVLPAVQLRAMESPGGARAGRWMVFALVWVALLLTVTRMTIVACAVQALLLLQLTGRTVAVGALATLRALCLAGGTIARSAVREFIWRTLSFETQSSISHTADWTEGMVALWEHPLGAGLATADLTAARFGREPLTADNLLFKYAVELGWPGLMAFVVFFAMLLVAGVQLARRTTGHARSGALLTVTVTVGILINGATAVVISMPFLAYVWAWLAGATVARHSQRHAHTSPLPRSGR